MEAFNVSQGLFVVFIVVCCVAYALVLGWAAGKVVDRIPLGGDGIFVITLAITLTAFLFPAIFFIGGSD